MNGRRDEREDEGPNGKYRGEGSLGESEPKGSDEGTGRARERNLEETLDRRRHGSGEYDPEERYGRTDVEPDREHAGPGDEDEPDTAERKTERGRFTRKQDPD